MNFLLLALLFAVTTKPFEYYFLRARIPSSWRAKNMYIENGRLFESDNKDVSVLSFGKEHYYFTYPTLIVVISGRKMTFKDIKRFALSDFAGLTLPESDRNFKRKWNPVNTKKYDLKNGYKLLYHSFYGNVLEPASTPVPIAIQVVEVKKDNKEVLFFSGFALANIGAYNKKELAAIQNGFMKHMQQVLNAAQSVKFADLKKDNALKKYLIKRKKFRHESSFANSISTGMFSVQTQGRRKIYFDFYRDGTLRFISTGYVGGFFNTEYGGDFLQSGASSHKNGKERWSKKYRFDIYKGKKYEYLVVHFPPDEGGDRVFLISKKGSQKCGKKTIRGLSIDGRVEGYFLTQGAVCTYKK